MTATVTYLDRAAQARRTIPQVIRILLAVDHRPARELAEALGISTGRLSERLTGKVRITSDELAACALFFDVDAGVFYRDPRSLRRQLLGPAASSARPTGEPTDRWINRAGQRVSFEAPNQLAKVS